LSHFSAGCLRLHVPDDVVLAVPDAEVGVAGVSLLRQGGDVGVGSPGRCGYLLEECPEGAVKALLARVTVRRVGREGAEVGGEEGVGRHRRRVLVSGRER
jgi:hypothetical protein